MNSLNLKKINTIFKLYTTTTPSNKRIFSYSLTKKANDKGIIFNIQQIEFNFVISFKIEEKSGFLTVTDFELDDNKNLKFQSNELYEASVVEIVQHFMDLIYNVFRKKHTISIYFDLDKKFNEYILPFKCFFKARCDVKSRIYYILDISNHDYEYFSNATSFICLEIQKELWKSQRNEKIIYYFLQSHQKGSVFPLSIFNNVKPSSALKSNIIAFTILQQSKQP